jgi:hypothetical protein
LLEALLSHLDFCVLTICCPNDATRIPQVAEVLEAAALVRFFWCRFCMELFAFVGEARRLAAGFAEDGQGGWRVFRSVGSDPDVQVAKAAVSRVPTRKSGDF